MLASSGSVEKNNVTALGSNLITGTVKSAICQNSPLLRPPQDSKLTYFAPSSSLVPLLCVIVTAVPIVPCHVALAVEIVSAFIPEQQPANPKPSAIRHAGAIVRNDLEFIRLTGDRPTSRIPPSPKPQRRLPAPVPSTSCPRTGGRGRPPLHRSGLCGLMISLSSLHFQPGSPQSSRSRRPNTLSFPPNTTAPPSCMPLNAQNPRSR